MKNLLARFLLLSLLVSIVACDKKPAPPGASAPPQTSTPDAAEFKPARETSFGEVTSQLDPGGNLFVYLSTDQWLAGLTTNLARFREVLQSFPDADASKRELMDRGFQQLTDAVKGSGVETLTGVGISEVQVTPELHRTKLILHHRKGQGDGLLWNVMGKRPHALTGMDLLTTNTAFAMYGDLDIKAIWAAVENGLGSSEIPDAAAAVKKWPELFEKQTKMSWDKLLASFGGELGLVLTLNDARKLHIPLGDKSLSMPTPGLMIAVKVNDELLYNRISSELKANQMVQVTDEKGLKMCVMPLPVPLPIDVQITVASIEGYFLVASSPALVQSAMAVREGKQPGLRKTADFEALTKHLPAEGNQFIYLDRRLTTTIKELQRQAAQSENLNRGEMEFVEKLFLNQQPSFGLSIGSHTEAGWQNVSVGNRNTSTMLLAAPAIPATAVMAAMLLPALAKAKERAQSISCVNNMKQQGLAFRMWALDHGDKFPFHVARSKGGTLEFCNRDADGYDLNSSQHFLVMSNELSTPKILVCPADSSRQVATDFDDLQARNVSYQVRSGPEVTDANPNEVLAYCPVHHHVCRVDGSVQQGSKNKPAAP